MSRCKALLTGVALLAATLGCQPTSPPTPTTPTSIPREAAATVTQFPTVSEEPSATPQATPLPVPQRALDTEGPWAVFSGAEGVYAINLDGSGMTLLMALPAWLQLGPVAPQGGRFSLITAEDASGTQKLTLHIFRLPEAALEKSIPLTGPQSEPGPDAQPGDAVFQAQMVYGTGEWSPDGQKLAFEGGMDSDNSDLYVYDSASGSVTRMTTGPALDFGPSWSPDGKYIVHFGAGTFGSGAGYDMRGAWATFVGNKSTYDLYPLDPKSGMETALGWLDAKTVLVYSFYASCTVGKLRAVHVESGKTTTWWPGYFNQFNIGFDPKSGATLLFASDTSSCEGGTSDIGGFLIDRNGKATRISDEEYGMPVWNPELGAFVFVGKELAYRIRPGESTAGYAGDASSYPFVSPDGKKMLWVDGFDGMLYGNFDDQTHIVNVDELQPPASNSFGVAINYLPAALWAKDSQSFLFASGENLLTGRSENDFVQQIVAPISRPNERFLFFKVNP